MKLSHPSLRDFLSIFFNLYSSAFISSSYYLEQHLAQLLFDTSYMGYLYIIRLVLVWIWIQLIQCNPSHLWPLSSLRSRWLAAPLPWYCRWLSLLKGYLGSVAKKGTEIWQLKFSPEKILFPRLAPSNFASISSPPARALSSLLDYIIDAELRDFGKFGNTTSEIK